MGMENKKASTAKKAGKPKKFRAFQIPRYLPGSVKHQVMKMDLLEYNKHRFRIFNMTARVDAFPPTMNPHRYVNAQSMANNRSRMLEIDKQNKEMIRRINIINRKGGRVGSFNPLAYIRQSKWRMRELKNIEMEFSNRAIYKMLVDVKSAYSTNEMENFWKKMRHEMVYNARYPPFFLKNKTIDQQISEQASISCICGTLGSSERPMCFMDIRVKDGVYLGRLVIELYQDYVPVTVQNFMSICCGEYGLTYKNSYIHKVITGKCLEAGDITKGNGKGGTSIYGDTFDEENFYLQHNRTGVLSTIPVGKGSNNSQFSITFCHMDAFNGVRVVFGKVVRGNATLLQINDMARKFGRPVAPVIICDCGEFIKGRTPAKLQIFKYF